MAVEISILMKKLILDLNRFAISAHNVQPFRFQFSVNDVFVFLEPSCILPVADPHHKDLWMSLGALVETLSIGLAEHGLEPVINDLQKNFTTDRHIAILTFRKIEAKKHPLASVLSKRFSYRGRFEKLNSKLIEAAKRELEADGFSVLADKKSKNIIAKIYNSTNLKFLTSKGYIEELYSWLRFSPLHPRWKYDGLNAESIALNSVETWGAETLLKPRSFRFLAKLGLAGFVIDEGPQINSAHFIAAISCPLDTTALEKGRLFLRYWLKLAEHGVYGAPLSLLTDETSVVEKLKPLFKLQSTETFVNIIRCGLLPKNYKRYPPARLNSEHLLRLEP